MEMFEYLFFLTPELIYETLPFAILVAVLVHLGVLSKQNEITAFRACGVSLYRLAMPLLLAARYLPAAVSVRLLLRARRQPQAGRHARRDQGPAQTDLPTRGPQVDHGPLAHLLLRIFDHAAGVCTEWMCSTWTQYVSPEARNCGGARAVEPGAEDVGFRERLELPFCRRLVQRIPVLSSEPGGLRPAGTPT